MAEKRPEEKEAIESGWRREKVPDIADSARLNFVRVFLVAASDVLLNGPCSETTCEQRCAAGLRPSLRHLASRVVIDNSGDFRFNPATFAILETLQNSATFLSSQSLTGISIATVYGLCDVDIIWRDMQESLGVWRYLDSILSHGSFPQLARISLIFDFSESRGLSLESMARLEGKINNGFDPMMPNFGSQGRGIVEAAVVKPSRYE
ncbi:hypothetical protein NMY22_g7149 [Coprinellus aureogranulatus]|nr:hypothetical protein NMY22_g7149 [Coprinellus aureogranulatus]